MDRTATSLTASGATEKRPVRLRHPGLKRALAYAFALACLIWVFHDVNPRRLLAAMSIGNWWFIAFAIVVDILTFVLQGLRWKLLLAPVGRLSSLRATQAIYAGLFTNELVPLRFGELVRAFLVSRWLSTPFASVLPSIVVERFLDGVCLAAAIGLAAILVPLPRQFLAAGYALGCIVLLAAALLLWLVFRGAVHDGRKRDIHRHIAHGTEDVRYHFDSNEESKRRDWNSERKRNRSYRADICHLSRKADRAIAHDSPDGRGGDHLCKARVQPQPMSDVEGHSDIHCRPGRAEQRNGDRKGDVCDLVPYAHGPRGGEHGR